VTCAVIWTDLPLCAQILQPEIAHLLAAGVHVMFLGRQIPAWHPDIMACVAEGPGTQESDQVLIVADHVKMILHRDGKWKGAYFCVTLVQQKAGVGETIHLETSIQVRPVFVMAEVACNSGSAKGRLCARRRVSSRRSGQ